ncbi:hypothetical protein J472_3761, partial [Acinetobacter baumannii 18689]
KGVYKIGGYSVLKRLPTHKVTQIEELLPHCWKPKSN